MRRLKPNDYKILFELVKNSKISDRKLSKIVGVSQPTVTRKRARLEKEKLIDYTALPNMEKLGFEIMAFTFTTGKPEATSIELAPQIKSFATKHPNTIFTSFGRGIGMNKIVISLHQNYSDYANFLKELEEAWEKFTTKIDTFIVSLKGDDVVRNITFKFLEDYMKKTGMI